MKQVEGNINMSSNVSLLSSTYQKPLTKQTKTTSSYGSLSFGNNSRVDKYVSKSSLKKPLITAATVLVGAGGVALYQRSGNVGLFERIKNLFKSEETKEKEAIETTVKDTLKKEDNKLTEQYVKATQEAVSKKGISEEEKKDKMTEFLSTAGVEQEQIPTDGEELERLYRRFVSTVETEKAKPTPQPATKEDSMSVEELKQEIAELRKSLREARRDANSANASFRNMRIDMTKKVDEANAQRSKSESELTTLQASSKAARDCLTTVNAKGYNDATRREILEYAEVERLKTKGYGSEDKRKLIPQYNTTLDVVKKRALEDNPLNKALTSLATKNAAARNAQTTTKNLANSFYKYHGAGVAVGNVSKAWSAAILAKQYSAHSDADQSKDSPISAAIFVLEKIRSKLKSGTLAGTNFQKNTGLISFILLQLTILESKGLADETRAVATHFALRAIDLIMSDLNQDLAALQRKLLGDNVEATLTLTAAAARARHRPLQGLLAKELKAFIEAGDKVLQAGRKAITDGKDEVGTKTALVTAANDASKLSLGSISCSLETNNEGQITKININH